MENTLQYSSDIKTVKLSLLKNGGTNIFSKFLPVASITCFLSEETLQNNPLLTLIQRIGFRMEKVKQSFVAKSLAAIGLKSSNNRVGLGMSIVKNGDLGFSALLRLTPTGREQITKTRLFFEKVIQEGSYLKYYPSHFQNGNSTKAMSQINKQALFSQFFYVKVSGPVVIDTKTLNRGSLTITIPIQEVPAPESSIFSGALGEGLDVLQNIAGSFEDALTAIEDAGVILDNTNTFLFETAKTYQSFGNRFSGLINSIRDFGNVLQELRKTPSLFAKQFSIIGKNFAQAIVSIGADTARTNSQNRQVVLLETKKLIEYNQNYKPQKQLQYQGVSIVDYHGVTKDIVNGKNTLFIRIIGLLALLESIVNMTFGNKNEVTEVILAIQNAKKFIFEENKFNGLNLSDTNIDLYNANTTDSDFMQTLHTLTIDSLSFLMDLRRNLKDGNRIEITKLSSLEQIAITYYGTSIIQDINSIIDLIINANPELYLTPYSLIEKDTFITLPIL